MATGKVIGKIEVASIGKVEIISPDGSVREAAYDGLVYEGEQIVSNDPNTLFQIKYLALPEASVYEGVFGVLADGSVVDDVSELETLFGDNVDFMDTAAGQGEVHANSSVAEDPGIVPEFHVQAFHRGENNDLGQGITDSGSNVFNPYVSGMEDQTPPVITTPNVVVFDENSLDPVLHIGASDSSGVSYSLKDGMDSSLFNIDQDTGVLRFNNAPDYENPQDIGGDNEYNVEVVVTDAVGNYTTQLVSVNINNVNEAPVAVADTDTVDENLSVTVDVLANDIDVDNGHSFTLDNVSSPKGNVSIVDNKLVFEADATEFDHLAVGESENVVVTYTMSDEHGVSSTSTATITVTGTNDVPVAINDGNVGAQSGLEVTGLFYANSDVNILDSIDDPLYTTSDHYYFDHSSMGVTGYNYMGDSSDVRNDQGNHNWFVDHGIDISQLRGGVIEFADGTRGDIRTASNGVERGLEDNDPNNDYTESSYIYYNTNATPIVTSEDTPISIDVLANDTDIDGDNLTIKDIQTSSKTHGTVDIVDGKLEFTPDADYNGNATFSYTVEDGHGGEDTATVNIIVTPVNDAPVAVDDGSVDGTIDTDADYGGMIAGAANAVTVTGLYEAGSTENLLDGKPVLDTLNDYRFVDADGDGTPDRGYNYMGGHDYFSDNGINTSSLRGGVITFSDGTVGIIDSASNGVERDNNGDGVVDYEENAYIYYKSYENLTPHTDSLDAHLDVTADHAHLNVGSEADFDFTTAFTISQNVTFDQNGNGGIIFNKENAYELAVESNGSIRYALNEASGTNTWAWNDTGYDLPKGEEHHISFSYDGANQTVKLYVDGAEVFSGNQNVPTSLANTSADLRFGERGSNRQPFEGQIDDIQIHSTTLSGSEIANIANGGVVSSGLVASYDFNGDSPLEDTSGNGHTATLVNSAEVVLTHTGVEHPFTTDEDKSLDIDVATLLANDIDVDGDTLSIDSISVSHGSATLSADKQTITYTPDKDYDGADTTLTYTVDDGNGGTDTATVKLVVNSVIEGTNNDDTINSGDGNDTIDGKDGNDIIYGGAGNDTIDGGKGQDHIYGGDGDDTIDGGKGKDYIDGGAGQDIIHAGKGFDTVVYDSDDSVIDGGTNTNNTDKIDTLVISDNSTLNLDNISNVVTNFEKIELGDNASIEDSSGNGISIEDVIDIIGDDENGDKKLIIDGSSNNNNTVDIDTDSGQFSTDHTVTDGYVTYTATDGTDKYTIQIDEHITVD